MQPRFRPKAFAVVLAVVMAIPVAAAAKPASSFELSMSYSNPNSQASFTVDFDELGNAHFSFARTEVAIVSCAAVSGLTTTSWVVDAPLSDSEVWVSRKLDDLLITGSVPVTRTVSEFCPETGLVEHSTTSIETVVLEGSSPDRLRRARMDGARVLSSTLDPLTLSLAELGWSGVGILRETISK
ncbi:MAG TPA: hypothetical protein VMS74_10975 [Acidimicrobiia bacterium]|nr:hypothetical protein [Acidimicrobiia bacterium]